VQRREFLSSCAVLSGGAALGAVATAWAEATPRLYTKSRLIDIHGAPIRADALAIESNYVFHYPYASTPCLLLRLARPVSTQAALRREDGVAYSWQGGVGPSRTLVAFSAICAHKLAYPTRDVSFIRYQRERSATSSGHVIHCCADHSVYDPAEGARVVAGPAPQPLAAILLEHDAPRDELYALGTIGPEQFDRFFTKYDYKLTFEYGGSNRAHAPTGDTCVVHELASFCRTTIQC
jgi:Rieske Fe-S protein